MNFATKSWFPYGFKCLDIYRKTREKIPVFPVEWLLIENIKYLEKTKMDKETVRALFDHYSEVYKAEKRHRRKAEESLGEQVQAIALTNRPAGY